MTTRLDQNSGLKHFFSFIKQLKHSWLLVTEFVRPPPSQSLSKSHFCDTMSLSISHAFVTKCHSVSHAIGTLHPSLLSKFLQLLNLSFVVPDVLADSSVSQDRLGLSPVGRDRPGYFKQTVRDCPHIWGNHARDWQYSPGKGKPWPLLWKLKKIGVPP